MRVAEALKERDPRLRVGLVGARVAVPAALGVQEGAFLAVGGALGLAPPTSLALAWGAAARDALLFVPALVAWQWQEARGWLDRAGPAGSDAEVGLRTRCGRARRPHGRLHMG